MQQLNGDIQMLEHKQSKAQEELTQKKLDLKDQKQDEYAIMKKKKDLIEGKIEPKHVQTD